MRSPWKIIASATVLVCCAATVNGQHFVTSNGEPQIYLSSGAYAAFDILGYVHGISSASLKAEMLKQLPASTYDSILSQCHTIDSLIGVTERSVFVEISAEQAFNSLPEPTVLSFDDCKQVVSEQAQAEFIEAFERSAKSLNSFVMVEARVPMLNVEPHSVRYQPGIVLHIIRTPTSGTVYRIAGHYITAVALQGSRSVSGHERNNLEKLGYVNLKQVPRPVRGSQRLDASIPRFADEPIILPPLEQEEVPSAVPDPSQDKRDNSEEQESNYAPTTNPVSLEEDSLVEPGSSPESQENMSSRVSQHFGHSEVTFFLQAVVVLAGIRFFGS